MLSAKSLQLCLTLSDPMDCSPPGSSVHGVLQGKILEWLAIPFSRGYPDPGIKPTSPASPALAGRFFTIESLGPKEQIIHSRNAYILDDSDYTTFFKKQNNGDNKTLVVVIGGRGARDEQAELRMFLGL